MSKIMTLYAVTLHVMLLTLSALLHFASVNVN